MEHKFVESENDDRRHCAYCGFYEDYAELHCPARAEETKLIEAAPIMRAALLMAFNNLKCNCPECRHNTHQLNHSYCLTHQKIYDALIKAEGRL